MTKSSIAVRRDFLPGNIVSGAGAVLPTRRDSIIGVLVSFSILFGAAWISELKKGGKPRPMPREDAPVIQIVMPKLEPDPPEVVEDIIPPKAEVAAPTLDDFPQPETKNPFVQLIQPTPPDTIPIDRNAITIPVNTGAAGSGIQVFDPSQLDQQPVPTVQARPTYPFDMRHLGASGQVVVDFIVDTSGRVHSAFAASSSQHEFESAAVTAVSKWRFRPGRKGGRAVNTHMQVPIVFTLNADDGP